MEILCVKIRSCTAVTSSRDFTRGRLLETGPSNYRSVRLHCGVERSLHAGFRGDWSSSFGVTDIPYRQTDRQTDMLDGVACLS